MAMDKAEEYLARTGPAKINAYISLESSSAKDVAEAFKRAKPQDAMVMAMDVDQATLQLVKDGTIKATISRSPLPWPSLASRLWRPLSLSAQALGSGLRLGCTVAYPSLCRYPASPWSIRPMSISSLDPDAKTP